MFFVVVEIFIHNPFGYRPWVWGIFPYHHYHTTAWEALFCVKGSAQIQASNPLCIILELSFDFLTSKVGGSSGPVLKVQKGDVLLVPPGVAHKQLDAINDFTLLGSYPQGLPIFVRMKFRHRRVF